MPPPQNRRPDRRPAMSDTPPSPARLLSVDALRGADILIIAGVDTLVYRLAPLFPHSGFMRGLREQMGHVAWEGLAAYDLVFPLFVFLAGVSLYLSLEKRAGLPTWRRLGRLWRRAALLIMLGWVINGPVTLHPATMRFASVLGLIGLSGALSGTLALLWRGKAWGCVLTVAALLLGSGAAQHLGGDFTPRGCLNAAIDRAICPGRLHLGCLDPEGPLCILSATALCLCGYAAGAALRALNTTRHMAALLGSGLLCLALAYPLPCIKNIWTPGFTLIAAGCGCLLLALFHVLLDLCPASARVCILWAYPLRVAGANALFLYLFTHLFNLNKLAERLFCGLWGALLPADTLPAAYAATALLLALLPALWLFRRGLYLRL